jgi:hypothetical protein
MRELTKKHHSESGVVVGLLLMLTGFFTGHPVYFKVAFAVLILSLAMPIIFAPFSFVWFNLSDRLGKITSVVILAVVYLIVLMPVAMIRRLAGKDSLSLRKFKKATTSVFFARNTVFRSDSIGKPY